MIITTDKEMRPRDEHDHYPTPPELVAAALRECLPSRGFLGDWNRFRVLDAGAGTGVWGQVLRQSLPSAVVTGVELRDTLRPEAYADWHANTDFLTWDSDGGYDFVIGNPPYKFAEQFVRKGHDQLSDGGTMILLLRLAFLEGQARMAGIWSELPPYCVYVLGARPSFTGNGKTDATAYAVFVWHKESDEDGVHTHLKWLYWKPAPPPKGKKRGKRETEVVVPA